MTTSMGNPAGVWNNVIDGIPRRGKCSNLTINDNYDDCHDDYDDSCVEYPVPTTMSTTDVTDPLLQLCDRPSPST